MSDSEEVPLEGWKAIAAYLGRSVKTVQRWEEEKNLPVYRHDVLGVGAYPSALEEWKKNSDRSPALIQTEAASSVVLQPEESHSARVGKGRFAVALWVAMGAALLAAAVLFGSMVTAHRPASAELRALTSDGSKKAGNLWTDGKFVYFTEISGQRSRLVFTPVAGGEVTELHVPGAYDVSLLDARTPGPEFLLNIFTPDGGAAIMSWKPGRTPVWRNSSRPWSGCVARRGIDRRG